MKKLFAIAVLGLMLAGCTYSEGDRTGKIFKLSKKGYVIKTWEGEMIIGDTGLMMGRNVWRFSVKDDAVAERIKAAGDQLITISYKQVYGPSKWVAMTDTQYIVTDVKAGSNLKGAQVNPIR